MYSIERINNKDLKCPKCHIHMKAKMIKYRKHNNEWMIRNYLFCKECEYQERIYYNKK